MEYTNYIYDLFDGEISPEKETALFREFAINEELRSSFRSQLNMKLSLAKRTPVATLDTMEKSLLFGKLGLALPSLAGDKPAVRRKLPRRNNIFWAGGAAVITFLLTYFLFMSDSQEGISSISKLPDYKPSIVEIHIPRQTAAMEKSDTKKMEIKSPVKLIARSPLFNEKHNPEKSRETTKSYQPTAIENSIPAAFNKPSFPVASGGDPANLSNIGIPEYSNLIENMYESKKNDFSLELSGSNYYFTKYPLIGPQKWAHYNNTDISFYYIINQDLSFGLEYRRENFYLRYDVDENGIPMIYEQQPNFSTIAMACRFSPVRIGLWSPFAQISAGGNKVGSVIRGGLGVKINYSSMVGFILGADYSMMIFNIEGAYYYSSKYGLKYGVVFKF